MALPALLGAGLKSMGGGLVKGAAKGAATNFVKGKKTKVKPELVKGGREEEKKPGALAVRPKTSMVPAGAIVPAPIQEPTSSEPAGEKTEQDTILIIKEKVIQIQNILKGTLAADKARSKAERRGLEKQKRKKQETGLEKVVPNKDKKAGKKFNVPGKGLLSGVFDFFKNLFLGWVLIKLVQIKLPGGQSLLAFIGGSIDFITDLVLGILDAAGTFLLWGKKAYEGTKGFIEDNFGEGAGEAFENVMTNLNKAFNLITIIALGVAAFNPFEGLGKDKNKRKVKLDKRGRDANKRRQIKKDFDRIRKENPKLSRKDALARAEKQNRDVKKRREIKKEYDKIRKDNPKVSKPDALKKATQAVDAPPKPRGGVFGFFDRAGEALSGAAKGARDLAGKGVKALGGGLNFLSGGNLGKLGGFLQDQYKNASEFARKQYDKLVAVGQKLKAKYNSAVDSAKGFLQKVGEAAQKKILQPILDKLKPFTDPIIEMAKKLQGVIMDNLKKIPGFDNILQVLKKKGINSLGDVGNIAKKVGGKALPVIGGIFNLMFAYDRLASGDTIGALLETLSAGFDLAGLVPGGQFGPPISMGIDAYMFARDFVPAIQEKENEVVNGMGLGSLKANLDKAASSLPDLGSLVKMFTGGDKENEKGDNTQGQDNGFGSADNNTGSNVTNTNTGAPSGGAGIRNQGEGSKLAGELGRHLDEQGLGGWGSGVHQHPEHSPWPRESGHRSGSLHYESQGGRAIDIGGWGPNLFRRKGQSGVDDQTQIINAIKTWEQGKGITQRAEFAHEGNDPGGHADHVHVAYSLGGLVKGMTHAMLGEKGKEFVVDNDSYTAIEKKMPGYFDEINAAKGEGAVDVIEKRHAELMKSTNPQKISDYDAKHGAGAYSKKLKQKLGKIYSSSKPSAPSAQAGIKPTGKVVGRENLPAATRSILEKMDAQRAGGAQSDMQYTKDGAKISGDQFNRVKGMIGAAKEGGAKGVLNHMISGAKGMFGGMLDKLQGAAKDPKSFVESMGGTVVDSNSKEKNMERVMALPPELREAVLADMKRSDSAGDLMSYTDYEKPQTPQMQMAGGQSAPGYSGGDEGDSTAGTLTPPSPSGGSTYRDILYKFG